MRSFFYSFRFALAAYKSQKLLLSLGQVLPPALQAAQT